MVYIARRINDPLYNTPVQIGLILSWFITQHEKFYKTVLMNLALTVGTYFAIKFVDEGYLGLITIQFVTAFFFGMVVNFFMFRNKQSAFYVEATDRSSLTHAYNEMKKMLFPHQLELIQAGYALEETMPVGHAIACVLSFDIINSSKIVHEKFHEIKDEAFAECFDATMQGYAHSPLTSQAFWLKDVGDGFFCSVGFPFPHSGSGTTAEISVKLAEKFCDIFADKIQKLSYFRPIHCAVGIGFGEIEGYFSNHQVTRYDLNGRAIILATRYESLRKVMFEDSEISDNLIILPEKVYANLSETSRQKFIQWDARAVNHSIRDDASATLAFYKLQTAPEGSQTRSLTA